jgi:hypothetical protein
MYDTPEPKRDELGGLLGLGKPVCEPVPTTLAVLVESLPIP